MTRAWKGLAVALALAILAGTAWRLTRRAIPEPPALPASADVDPAVARLLARMRDELLADRRDGERWRELGLAHDTNAMAEAALQCFEQAVLLLPGDAKSWFHLGRLRGLQGDTVGALAAFSQSRELDPRYPATSWRSGFLRLEADDLPGARADFERALSIAPGDAPATVGLARVALAGDDGVTAERLLRPLLIARAEDASLRFLLGTALRKQGRMDEAEAELRAGASTVTRWHDPWELEALQYQVSTFGLVNQALAASADGHHERAIELLEPLARREPDTASVIVNLASEYVAVGRFKEAMGLLARVAAKEPTLGVAHAGLAEAALGAEDFAAALAHAERAIALDSTEPRVHEYRAAALSRVGRVPESVPEFEMAVAADPSSANVHFGLGLARMQTGKPDSAASALQDATRLDPAHGQAWLALALTQLTLGEFDAAEAAFRKANTLGTVSPEELKSALEQVAKERLASAAR